MKVVVIGGVAAGMSAASKIKREKPDWQVTVYEKGAFLSYGACGLPYYVGDFNPDAGRLLARTKRQFDEQGIESHLNHEVVALDTSNKTITVKRLCDGTEIKDNYDKLMIACGCHAVAPPIEGIDNPGVFFLHTMEDGLFFKEIAKNPAVERVAVVGGGYVGVEMCEAFLNLGKKVLLIEGGERILSPFEPEFSKLAAEELQSRGIEVHAGEPVVKIEEAGNCRRVCTDKGTYDADIILMSAGIRPATGFLKDSGLRFAKNGAIYVDRQMRTDIPDVYAAGDCAICHNKITNEDFFLPLGTVANKCGRIAGANIAGGSEEFCGALGSAAIKVCGIEMARTGMSENDARRLGIDYKTKMVAAYDHPAYYPDQSLLMIKLIYENGTRRLLGANVGGKNGAVLRCDVFAVAIHNGMSTDELGMVDLVYAPPFATVWDAVHIAANAAK